MALCQNFETSTQLPSIAMGALGMIFAFLYWISIFIPASARRPCLATKRNVTRLEALVSEHSFLGVPRGHDDGTRGI